MSGSGWLIFSWGAIAFFLAVTIYRVVTMARLPVHLRWELAPVPHDKGKGTYGGSYLEEYEWWKRKRNTSFFGPLFYMAGEILLLKGVWKHNRSLWPLSMALHGGIYLLTLVLVAHLCLAVLSPAGLPSVSSVCSQTLSLLSACACILGTAGSGGLILKRIFDPGMRWSNTAAVFLNLILALAVFVSGLLAWSLSPEPVIAANAFVAGLVTISGPANPGLPLSVHVTITLLFVVYLPFTSMLHFAGKYFMYHGVRWNDGPVSERMAEELKRLLSQPVTWSGGRAERNEQKSWAKLTGEETGNEET